jgi:hypothetical protein
MTTPRVTELPRRLEPIGNDTFLGGCDDDAQPPARDLRPLAAVVQLRPRDPLAPRRAARARRGPHPPRPGSFSGPGDSAA